MNDRISQGSLDCSAKSQLFHVHHFTISNSLNNSLEGYLPPIKLDVFDPLDNFGSDLNSFVLKFVDLLNRLSIFFGYFLRNRDDEQDQNYP